MISFFKFWFVCYFFVTKVKEQEREIRILILGLDNAGKTTIVKRLCGQPIDEIEPTLGFQIHTLSYNSRSRNRNTAAAAAAAATTTTNDGENDDSNTPWKEGESTNTKPSNEKNNDDDNQQGNNVLTSTGSVSTSTPSTVASYLDSTYQLNLWDIGGQSSIRAYWRNYFETTDGLIWVVDSSDMTRLPLVQQELQTVLRQERLAGATLLIFANKQDVSGSLSSDEIAKELELIITSQSASHMEGINDINEEDDTGKEKDDDIKTNVSTRHWAIIPCSAVTGEGLEKGIDWLVEDIGNRIFMML